MLKIYTQFMRILCKKQEERKNIKKHAELLREEKVIFTLLTLRNCVKIEAKFFFATLALDF